MRKHFPFLAHGLLPVPNVKSSSLYRTTNTTTLVKQNQKKKKKKGKQQQHGARDGCCAERSQPWPLRVRGASVSRHAEFTGR